MGGGACRPLKVGTGRYGVGMAAFWRREAAAAAPDQGDGEPADDLAVNLLGECHQFRDRAALDESQCFVSDRGVIIAVLLALQPELGLGVDEAQHIAVSELAVRGQPTAEVQRRRAVHQGVVHIEECGGPIGRRVADSGPDIRSGAASPVPDGAVTTIRNLRCRGCPR